MLLFKTSSQSVFLTSKDSCYSNRLKGPKHLPLRKACHCKNERSNFLCFTCQLTFNMTAWLIVFRAMWPHWSRKETISGLAMYCMCVCVCMYCSSRLCSCNIWPDIAWDEPLSFSLLWFTFDFWCSCRYSGLGGLQCSVVKCSWLWMYRH